MLMLTLKNSSNSNNFYVGNSKFTISFSKRNCFYADIIELINSYSQFS